jgi:GTP-binding protein HflX
VLAEIGAEAVPVVEVYNKVDLVSSAEVARLSSEHPQAVLLSATHGTGQDRLLDVMAGRLALDVERLHLEFDSGREADRRLVADLYRHARIVSHVGENGRVQIEADVPRRLVDRFGRARVSA